MFKADENNTNIGNVDKRDSMNSKDFIAQLYVKNCALCVLSRFGLADDISDVREGEVNVEFTEAAHLAGILILIIINCNINIVTNHYRSSITFISCLVRRDTSGCWYISKSSISDKILHRVTIPFC